METRKKSFIITGIVYIILYFLFFKFMPRENFGTAKKIMTSIGSGIIFLMMFSSYKKNRVMKKYYFALLLTGFFYLMGNLLWVILNLTWEEKMGMNRTVPLSLLSNLSLVTAVYFLMEKSLKKWDGIKIFLDSFILGLMLFYVAWAMIFNNIVTYLLFDSFHSLEKLYFLFCLVLNFLIFFGLLIFYLFNKNYLKRKNNMLEAFGFFFWFIADLSLLYFQLYGNYEYLYIINIFWLVSLFVLAISTLTPKEKEISRNTLEELRVYSGKNIIFNTIIIFLGVVLFFIAPVTFLIILPILVFRTIFSKYIKLSRYNVVLVENVNLDPLTKLYNRKKFSEELGEIFKNSENSGILIIVEINRFKYINSVYGYSVGDKILSEMGERIKGISGENLISGRWNGDEFIIYMKNIDNKENGELKGREILNLLKKPINYNRKEIVCSLNMGIAITPKDSSSIDELIKYADSALIKSCNEGKDRIVFFQKNSGMEEKYREI